MTIYDEVTAEIDTQRVLSDVAEERHRQRQRYGLNRDLEDGTGPDVRWLAGAGRELDLSTAAALEGSLRAVYEQHEQRHGRPTWRHLVLEEVAEAFAESDPVRLRAELLQVAALAVSWVETLDARRPCEAELSTKSYTHRCTLQGPHHTHRSVDGCLWTNRDYERTD
jgi:hypothetical protein